MADAALIVENARHLIELRSVSRRYLSGESMVAAVDSVDFSADDGEFVAIMGQSGSGKSTLLSILGGLNQPSTGQVIIDGLDVYRLTSEQRADFRNEYLGFVFQSFQLIPYLSVIENVLLPLAITGIKARIKAEMATDVLAQVGLADKRRRLPDELSGGEQERVAIARAIVNRPPVLLADEPTGNLDQSTTADVLDVFHRLQSETGITIVMVTHSAEAASRANRTVHLADGRIVPPPVL